MTEQFEDALKQEVALLSMVPSWGLTSHTQQGLAPVQLSPGKLLHTSCQVAITLDPRNVKILSSHKFSVPLPHLSPTFP